MGQALFEIVRLLRSIIGGRWKVDTQKRRRGMNDAVNKLTNIDFSEAFRWSSIR
jgi:hypothetical protein